MTDNNDRLPHLGMDKELAKDLIEQGTSMTAHGNTLLRDANTVMTTLNNRLSLLYQDLARVERDALIRCATTTEIYAQRLIKEGQDSIATGRRILSKLVDEQGPSNYQDYICPEPACKYSPQGYQYTTYPEPGACKCGHRLVPKPENQNKD